MGTHGQGETGGVVLWEMSDILYLLPEQLMERIDRERQHVNLFVKTHNKSLGGGGRTIYQEQPKPLLIDDKLMTQYAFSLLLAESRRKTSKRPAVRRILACFVACLPFLAVLGTQRD